MNKKDLIEALKIVQPAVTEQSLTAQNNLIIFNRKTVKAYNDEILITTPIKVPIKGAVPAKELFTLLQKIKGDTIKIKQKGNSLEVSNKTTVATLKMEELKGLKVENTSKWYSLPKDFLKGIDYCKFSLAGQGDVLNNIYISTDKIISCDNFRITQYIMKDGAFEKDFLISSSTIEPLITLKPTSFALDNHWIFFKNKNKATLYIKRTGAKYPNIKAILNSSNKGTKVKLPKELKDGLLRAKILSEEDTTTGNNMINITIKDNKLTCYGKCALGQIEESIKIDYKGKKLSFTIVPDFLIEILEMTQTMLVEDSCLIFKTTTLQHRLQLIK